MYICVTRHILTLSMHLFWGQRGFDFRMGPGPAGSPIQSPRLLYLGSLPKSKFLLCTAGENTRSLHTAAYTGQVFYFLVFYFFWLALLDSRYSQYFCPDFIYLCIYVSLSI